jgi:pyridoxamine 5'-phosphate oxidase
LLQNPHAALNFWFAMQRRQVIFEGTTTPLSHNENQRFWDVLPHERQLRFSSCAPRSGAILEDPLSLEKRKAELTAQFTDQIIPMDKHYCGFRFTPHTIFFYKPGIDTFSELIRYKKIDENWQHVFMSP